MVFPVEELSTFWRGILQPDMLDELLDQSTYVIAVTKSLARINDGDEFMPDETCGLSVEIVLWVVEASSLVPNAVSDFLQDATWFTPLT
jgi:hypothetical protein